VPFSTWSGARVIAFEPLPAAFKRLREAVRHAHGGVVPGHVTLEPLALGARAGVVALEVPSIQGVAQEQWASTVKDYRFLAAQDARIDAVARYLVRVRPLDAFTLERVTAIKLDAEGAEAEILAGAEATLRRWQPLISVEIEERHRPGSTHDVPHWLAELGYEGWFVLGGFWHPMGAFDAGAMQVASPSPASFAVSEPYIFTFYFIPAERRPELAVLAPLAPSARS
jgi:FkbM family methyltransferase